MVNIAILLVEIKGEKRVDGLADSTYMRNA
jgi:hypothetical protein